MKYKWAVYNKNNVLVTRTLTRRKAVEVASKYTGSFVKELFDSNEIQERKDYYGNNGK
jgi:hypothetical protein